MMCYRDTTFCIADCFRSDCPLKVTNELEAAAVAWSKANDIPTTISVADRSHNCNFYEPIHQPE